MIVTFLLWTAGGAQTRGRAQFRQSRVVSMGHPRGTVKSECSLVGQDPGGSLGVAAKSTTPQGWGGG